MTWHLPAVAVFGLLIGTFAVPAGAQGARKIFICVDMEGISGVSSAEQTGGSGADYNRARKMMADDTNAAIRGAVEGGATEIVVIDSHGSGHNLQRDDLEAPARLISENFRRYGMMEGSTRRSTPCSSLATTRRRVRRLACLRIPRTAIFVTFRSTDALWAKAA
jgi:hypothetical protein